MTYEQFKDFLVTFLWKQGDSVVIDSLDILIKLAEAELNRTLMLEERTLLVDLSATSTLTPLPTDYQEMRMLSNPHCREMKYNIPAKLFARRNLIHNTYVDYEAYTIVGNNIALAGNIGVSVPLDLTLLYYSKILSFQDTGSSWVEASFLDVFTYCVLKHSAPFLREDERIPVWENAFGTAIGTAITANDKKKYAGSPLKLNFPRGIR